jgi:hypothetical protein
MWKLTGEHAIHSGPSESTSSLAGSAEHRGSGGLPAYRKREDMENARLKTPRIPK